MKMNLVYTDVAIQDLQRLEAFIAVHNPHPAAETAAQLIEKLSLLKSFPHLGTPVTQAPEVGAVRDVVFDLVVDTSVGSDTRS
nr:type II toxin-antitoxin system RelE/ParE family toxin [Pseudidiomarina sp. 1APR75-33.1]